ncbi:plancitoxin-1-like [Asterias amurensis]|uniref:plancitoxin-1-like n=1 Tax=Asterias amurensis TaxID=7602 RepID=UPI003AB2BC7A
MAAAVVMQGDARITSRDEEGKPVDWIFVYKLPAHKTTRRTPKHVQEGCWYIYMDPRQTKPELSKTSLNATNNAITHTLNQIYKNRDSIDSKDFGYLMYNDTFPRDMGKSASQSHGHAKGVLAFDASGGFWLIHSTPEFPRKSSQSYNWPANAKRNGQSFLCVTFDFDQFEKIGKQLMYINPSVYDFYIPPKLATDVPSLVKVTQGKKVTSAPWYRRESLTSSGGQSFISFAKCSKYGQDIYSDLLAPYFNSNLLVQTWQSGRGKKIDSCRSGSYDVTNIRKMTLGSEVFPQTMDHSKWAVTDSEGSKWICIGDINRMESQKNRGGGIVCFENEAVHKYLLVGAKKNDEPPESEQTLPRPRVTQPVPQNIADTPLASITDLFEANVKICDENDEEDSSTASAIQESLDQQNQRTGIDEGKN